MAFDVEGVEAQSVELEEARSVEIGKDLAHVEAWLLIGMVATAVSYHMSDMLR